MQNSASFTKLLQQRLRIQRTIDHIIRHHHEKMSVQELSEIACYSPFHFQRLYTLNFGETWGETLCRTRLMTSAQQLLDSDLKIGDIAHLAGYETQVGFNKAFSKHFGLTPSKYKKQYAGEFYLPHHSPKSKRRGQLSPTNIIYTKKRYLITEKSKGCHLGRFDQSGWNAFTKLLRTKRQLSIASHDSSSWFGIIPDYRHYYRDHHAEYIAAIDPETIPPASTDRNLYEVPKGLYAVFQHTGPLPEQTLNTAIYDWLPESEFTLNQTRPILYNFCHVDFDHLYERFTSKALGQTHAFQQLDLPDTALQMAKVHIYLPIEALDASRADTFPEQDKLQMTYA